MALIFLDGSKIEERLVDGAIRYRRGATQSGVTPKVYQARFPEESLGGLCARCRLTCGKRLESSPVWGRPRGVDTDCKKAALADADRSNLICRRMRGSAIARHSGDTLHYKLELTADEQMRCVGTRSPTAGLKKEATASRVAQPRARNCNAKRYRECAIGDPDRMDCRMYRRKCLRSKFYKLSVDRK